MTDLSASTFYPVDAAAVVADDNVAPYYLTLGDRRLRIFIVRVDGRLHAFDDLCPCGDQSCPLSSGLRTGSTIMCQCHGSRFELTTGAVVNGPAVKPLRGYEVQEAGGEIQIRL